MESWQEVAPRSSAKVPGWHSSHSVAPEPLILPASHRVCVDAPVSLTKEPASAREQPDCPILGPYVPAPHSMHALAPEPENEPAGHGR